jgi:hypothetical protein
MRPQGEDGGNRLEFGWWRDGRCIVQVPEDSFEWDAVASRLYESLPTAQVVSLEVCW